MASLLAHPFTKEQEVWLRHAANTPSFDPRVARVRLLQELPRDFEPNSIDNRFYREHKLTLLGLRRFRPDHPLLATAEKVALAVRQEVLASPGIDELSSAQLAAATGLSQSDVNEAVEALAQLRPLFTGVGFDGPSSESRRYSLRGTTGYDAALAFSTLEDALERAYESQLWLGATPTASAGTGMVRYGQTAVPEETKPNTAFVIMAMDPSRHELTDVLEAIRGVCKDFGIAAHRADEIEHQEQITNVILREIERCEYLIADLSLERPNVYYEVGFAHALQKKPILYRRVGTPLHFDLAVHNVPEYRNITHLRELLTSRFEAILGRTAA